MQHDTVALIKQAISNIVDRVRKLESKQQVLPTAYEVAPYSEDIYLGTAANFVDQGASAVLLPGLYKIDAHYDFESGPAAAGLSDEGQRAIGQLLVNNVAMPGTAQLKLLTSADAGGTRRGNRVVVSQSWILSLWDYKQIVLQDNPDMFLRLDDDMIHDINTPTAVRDISKNGYNVSYNSGVRLLPGPINVGLDGRPSFSMQTARIMAPSAFVPATGAGTLEIWFRISTASAQALIGNASLDTHRNGAHLTATNTGAIRLELDSAAASQTLTSPATYLDNLWHHAVATWDGTTARLSIDGVEVINAAQTVTPAMPSVVRVGIDQSGTVALTDYVAEPAWYSNIALKADRILLHYQIGVSTYLPSTTYAKEVLADLPAVYYRLNEQSGAVMNDSSPNLRHGTYTSVFLNQPGAILVDPDGIYDDAAWFGGFYASSGYGSASDAGLPSGSSDRTLEAWIWKPSNTGVPFIRWLVFGYGTIASPQNGWFVTLLNGNVISFSTDSAWATSIDGTTPIASRRWHHIAIVTSGNNVSIYLNGNLEATGTVTINTVLSGALYIGNLQPVANRYFTGMIDEVSLTPSALSASRIAARFRSGRSNRAWVDLAAYKSGGTDLSYIHTAGTKLVVTQLRSVAKS